VTVEPLAQLAPATQDELAVEVQRLAPFRGAERGEVRVAHHAATI